MGAGVTNFLSVVEARSLGTADVDKMAAAIDKQSAALENLGKKADTVNKHPGFSEFAEKVRQGIENPLNAVKSAALSSLEALGPVGGAIAVVGSALASFAVVGYEAAKSLAEYGRGIENASLRTGLTTREVAQFSFAAKLVGQDIGSFETGMRGLTQAMTDNSAAGAKARQALHDLGVDPRALDGQLRPTGQILMELSAALNRLPDEWSRNEAGMAIFKRAWVEIGPAVLGLTHGVQVANEQGFFGPSDAQLAQWGKYHEQVSVAEKKFDNFTRKMKEWAAENVIPEENYYGNLNKRADERLQQQGWRFDSRFAPKAPQSAVGAALFNEDASRLQHDRDAGNSLLRAARSRMDSTLEGLRLATNEAKQKYDDAYREMQTFADVGSEAAQREIDKVSALKQHFEALNEQLKIAEKTESARLAILEKATQLRREGYGNTMEGFYQFGTGPGAFIVTQSQIAAANPRPNVPSLFGRGRNPDAVLASLPWMNEALGPRKAGTDPLTGDFISPESERSSGWDESPEQFSAFSSAWLSRMRSDQQTNLSLVMAERDGVARIMELRAGPGGELEAARQAAAIREQSLRDELEQTGDINRYREQSRQNEIEMVIKIAQEEKRRVDEFRSELGGVFDALLGGPKGIEQFAMGQARTLGRAAFSNILTSLFRTHDSLTPATIFGGTFLGDVFSPVKGSDVKLSSAGDRLTFAAGELIAAARTLAMLRTGGGGGLPGFGGFGLPGFGGGGSDLTALANLPGRGFDSTLAWGSAGINPADYTGGDDLSAALGDFAQYDASRGMGAPMGGVGFSPLTSGSNWLKYAGMGGAAIGGGLGIYAGIQSGGLAGASRATGAALAAAGGIMSMASKALSWAGPAGMIAGMALSFLPSLFGDPRQDRAKELQQDQQARMYTMPTGQDYSVDWTGHYVGSDYRGVSRGVGNTYNTTIQALDPQSFADLMQRNADAVVAPVVTSVASGNADHLVGALAQRMGV